MKAMRKTFLIFGIACMLMGCSGNGYSPIQFEKFEEQVGVTSPEGAMTEMTLTIDIPVGEDEVQNRLSEGIRTIIRESSVVEELKQPIEGSLKEICKKLIAYFPNGISKGEIEIYGATSFNLMVECEHQTEQAVVFRVTDGVYGNGGPMVSYKVIRLSDGKLMDDKEVYNITGDDIVTLVKKYGTDEQKEFDEAFIGPDGYLCPIGDSCRILYLEGPHFWNEVTVPVDEIKSFLTEEGKTLLGMNGEQTSKQEKREKDDEQKVQEDKHMEFLGLQLGGDPKPFIEALRQKGFADGWGSSDYDYLVFLRGIVSGKMSEISIDTKGNRVNSVSFGYMVESEAEAINLCNRFKEEMTAFYGGKWKKLYDGAEEMKLPYGSVEYSYGMFDSGDYEVGMTIKDTGTNNFSPKH